MGDQAYTKVQAQQKALIGLPNSSQFLQRPHSLHAAVSPPTLAPVQEHVPTPNLEPGASSRFVHDFSFIPVHSAQGAALQTTLDTNQINRSVPAKVPVSTGVQPGLIQRQVKHPEEKQPAKKAEEKAPAKKAEENPAVKKAKEKLINKFGLHSVEDSDVKWSVGELNEVYAAFSKMSPDEQAKLKGVTLFRTAKITHKFKEKKPPYKEHEEKRAGETSSYGDSISFTDIAFKSEKEVTRVALHEAGHVINKSGIHEAEKNLQSSGVTTDMNEKRKKFDQATDKIPKRFSDSQKGVGSIPAFVASINHVTQAVENLQNSKDADRTARQDELAAAQAECEMNSTPLEQYKDDANIKALLQIHDLQNEWVDAFNKWEAEKAKTVTSKEQLNDFVDIVKKNKLARSSLRSFTPYVKLHWDNGEPQEFFAETYFLWRTDPDYLKNNAKPLYDWFKSGGHLK